MLNLLRCILIGKYRDSSHVQEEPSVGNQSSRPGLSRILSEEDELPPRKDQTNTKDMHTWMAEEDQCARDIPACFTGGRTSD